MRDVPSVTQLFRAMLTNLLIDIAHATHLRLVVYGPPPVGKKHAPTCVQLAQDPSVDLTSATRPLPI